MQKASRDTLLTPLKVSRISLNGPLCRMAIQIICTISDPSCDIFLSIIKFQDYRHSTVTRIRKSIVS